MKFRGIPHRHCAVFYVTVCYLIYYVIPYDTPTFYDVQHNFTVVNSFVLLSSSQFVNCNFCLLMIFVQGHSGEAMRRAIGALVMRSELQELNQKKMLKRIR